MLIFRNLGRGQFEKVSDSLGVDFMRPIGRRLAAGDYDNNGDMDIVTNSRGAYPSLLRDHRGNANHWLEILLIEIIWPSGQIDRLTNVPIDEIIAVAEGAGMVNKNFPKIPPTRPASAPSKPLRK